MDTITLTNTSTTTASAELAEADPHAPLGAKLRSTLALVSLGYSPTQIAAVRRVAVGDVVRDLHQAVDLLGAQTVREAITAAARRGLLA